LTKQESSDINLLKAEELRVAQQKSHSNKVCATVGIAAYCLWLRLESPSLRAINRAVLQMMARCIHVDVGRLLFHAWLSWRNACCIPNASSNHSLHCSRSRCLGLVCKPELEPGLYSRTAPGSRVWAGEEGTRCRLNRVMVLALTKEEHSNP
jgi:hypothetical protein